MPIAPCVEFKQAGKVEAFASEVGGRTYNASLREGIPRMSDYEVIGLRIYNIFMNEAKTDFQSNDKNSDTLF